MNCLNDTSRGYDEEPVDSPEELERMAEADIDHLWNLLEMAGRNPDMKHTIYIVKARASGFIKIGITSDLEKRLRSLESATGSHIELLLSFRGALYLEQICHRTFGELRERGEWFRNEGRLAAFIDEMRDSQGYNNVPEVLQ